MQKLLNSLALDPHGIALVRRYTATASSPEKALEEKTLTDALNSEQCRRCVELRDFVERELEAIKA